MANGVKVLRQIQFNREDVQGVATSDYTPWRGTGVLKDTRVSVFPNEDIGIFSGVDRQYFSKLGAELTLEETEATFEQLPHILDAGIYNATPTTDTGSGYIRTYTSPIAGGKESSDLMTYSVKAGDNAAVEAFHFGFIREFSLSGTAGEAVKLTATMVGREATSDSDGFATVTVPNVEEILFSKGKFYIDDVSSSFGSTQVSNTLLGFSLNWTTGWREVYSADGRADFAFIKQVPPEVVLQITFEHNASAAAEKAAWRAGTSRLIQLKFEGAALSSSGAYTYKTLAIKLAGKWESFDGLGDQDGNDIVTGTFRARYNSTAAKFAEIVLVNEVATMPG